MKETFGQRFQRLRKNLGLKQEDIAEKVFVSPQAVSKWENDQSSPDITTLPILADILNVSLDELLGREIEETKVMLSKERKDVNSMILKIHVLSDEGDKVKINLPLAIIKICLESGMKLPQISGKVSLENINFDEILMMVESGVIGKLLEIESTDGNTVSIFVE